MGHNYNDDGTYTPEFWEAKAEEAETISDCMTNKVAKATMRVVAESYRVLARQARRNAKQHGTGGEDADTVE